MQTTFYEISFFHILVAKWISNSLKIFLLVLIKFPKINNSYFLTTIFFVTTFLFGVLFLLTKTIIAHIKFTPLLLLTLTIIWKNKKFERVPVPHLKIYLKISYPNRLIRSLTSILFFQQISFV